MEVSTEGAEEDEIDESDESESSESSESELESSELESEASELLELDSSLDDEESERRGCFVLACVVLTSWAALLDLTTVGAFFARFEAGRGSVSQWSQNSLATIEDGNSPVLSAFRFLTTDLVLITRCLTLE